MATLPSSTEAAAAPDGDLIASTAAVLDTATGVLASAGQSTAPLGIVVDPSGRPYRAFDFGSLRVEAGATLRA